MAGRRWAATKHPAAPYRASLLPRLAALRHIPTYSMTDATSRSALARTNRGRRPIHALDLILSIWVAFAFAAAQPLFDMLGRGADFFVARRLSPLDPVRLAIGLAIVAPLFAGALVLAARRLQPRLALTLHAAILGGLVALFALQALKRIAMPSVPGVHLILAAVAMGGLAVAGFWRWSGARTFFRVVSPAIVLFPALFLFASPVRTVIFPALSAGSSSASAVRHPVPIAMVVFDELPVSSLMDAPRPHRPVAVSKLRPAGARGYVVP